MMNSAPTPQPNAIHQLADRLDSDVPKVADAALIEFNESSAFHPVLLGPLARCLTTSRAFTLDPASSDPFQNQLISAEHSALLYLSRMGEQGTEEIIRIIESGDLPRARKAIDLILPLPAFLHRAWSFSEGQEARLLKALEALTRAVNPEDLVRYQNYIKTFCRQFGR